MIAAAALIAAGFGDWLGRSVIALSLARRLVLDTADGRLARLQGTCSAFGKWLDQVVDEFVDLALLRLHWPWQRFAVMALRSGSRSGSLMPRENMSFSSESLLEMNWKGASKSSGVFA